MLKYLTSCKNTWVARQAVPTFAALDVDLKQLQCRMLRPVPHPPPLSY